MKAASVLLHANTALDFVGSDGRFEVSAPAGAVTSDDIVAAGGQIHLHIEQLLGPSGGTNGGRIILGAYQISVLGLDGPLPLFAFHQPLTFTYHYAASDLSNIQPDHAFVILDDGSSLTPSTTTPKTQTIWSSTESRTLSTKSARNDPRSQTISYTTPANASVSGAATASATFGTSAPMASWGTVQDFQADLNAGALAYSYPFEVPTGPNGIKPDVQLAYSSGTVNETEGVQAAAPWVGEGWSLSLGSISWAQYQGDATSGTQENEWQITTPDGISAQLFPPNMSVTTTGTVSSITSPQWYTAPESHSKIIETTANTNGGTYACFRLWRPDGTMEEYGCTNDSRQWYVDSSGKQYTYRWDLDMIADPHGNQILISYNQLKRNKPGTSYAEVVDAEPQDIYYDFPTCQSTTTRCSTGSALVNLHFDTSNKPSRFSGSTSSACSGWNGTDRCDDPASVSGGLSQPEIHPAVVLNDLKVNVRPASSGAFNLLRAYYFWYEQGQGTTITDPATGLQEGTAGYLDLTQAQEFGTDSASGPSSTMYTSGNFEVVAQKNGQLLKYWVTPNGWSGPDATFGDGSLSASAPALAANPTTRCYYAYSMTSGQPTAYPALWSQTSSQRYLAAFGDGRGLHETFTWAEAHLNAWGGSNGQPSGDPLSCTGLETTEPCFRADDRNWSRVILVRRDETVRRAELVNGTPANTDVDTAYRYTYTLTPVQNTSYFLPFDSANNIQGGLYDWNWGSVNSADYLNYYNPEYRGFNKATVDVWESYDGGNTGTWLNSTDHFYSTTSGWGVWDAGYVTGTGGPGCRNVWNLTSYCPTSPYWSATSALPNQSPAVYPGNALPGREVQTDTYNISGGNTRTLLQRVITSYGIDSSGGSSSLDTCGPAGDPYSSPAPYPHYWSDLAKNNQLMLVSQLSNLSDPVAVCDPRMTSQDTFDVEGSTASIPITCTPTTAGIPCLHVDYSYDTNQSYGAHDYGNLTVEQTSGNDLGGAVAVKMMDYAAEDTIQASGSPPSGVYIVDAMQQQAVRDTSTTGTVHAFSQQFFDGSFTLGALGNWGEVTRIQDAYQTDSNSSTGYDSIVYRYTYDDAATGNALAERYPDLQPGGCTISSVGYSTCATYDTSTYDAHETSVTNALTYKTSTSYANASGGYDANNGFGQWITGITDPNQATTTFAYDALGRLTAIAKPVHSNATTQQFAYVNNCPATGLSQPCIELDTTQSIAAGVSATTRTFEDGAGRSVETLAPAPGGSGTLVSYTLYDALGRKVFVSEPYTVGTTTSFSAFDLTKSGTQYAYDALDRVTSTQLVPSYNAAPTNTTTTSYAAACGVVMGDSNCYQQATTIDPNGHRGDADTDALGRTVYARSYTGNSGTSYVAYATTAYQYDVLNHVTQITYPDGTHTATFSYDLLGRVTKQTDPDRGGSSNPWSYAYDADGNLVHQTDPRGSNVYIGYDALDRPVWRNTTNSQTGAYVTFSYDSTASFCPGAPCSDNNDFGVGHLTGETFSGSPNNSLSGSETFYYDANGRLFAEQQATTTSGSTPYTLQQSYNDADQPVTTTYPDGEQVTVDYTAAGAPQDMQSTPSGGSATFVISSVGYAPTGQIASLGFGGSPTAPAFTEQLTYDAHQHLTDEAATLAGASTPFYELALGYDQAYNVLSTTTTLPAVGTHQAGTEQQSFCYDEQNRLVWAGTTGTPSGPADGAGTCGATPAPATLDGGSYSASYAYDTLNRLTSGPGGSYTYGDPNHLDAVTETGGGYTASYDAAGNMSCRAPSSSATCTGGTPTGAKLTFDSEGRLAGWQSAYTLVNGTQTASYLYDGSGTRIEQSTSTRGFSGSTAILYLGNGLADYTFNNGAPTPTHVNHYTFAGRMVAVRDSTTGGTLHYLLADQINSPELQLSASGAAEAVVLRTPYGASRYGASALYSYGFTGQRQDDTTSGLDYDHARYYDPAVGQFVSADSDPKGGLNRFAYVAGNPETATDPTGHRSDCRRFNECSGGGKGGCTSNCTPQQPTGPQNPQKPQNPKGCRATGTCDSDGNYCDKACQIEKAEEAAKNDALGSANLLQVVGQWLTWFTWLVGAATIFVTAGAALAAVFQPETLPMWAMWSARLLIFTIQLAQLIGTVNYYHDMFAGEADHDLSWFTGPHVEDYLSSRNSVFAFMGITADGTNLLALAATITKWGAKALGVTLPGYVGVAINAVALVGLYAYTEAQINQQEADLCPTALAQAHGC